MKKVKRAAAVLIGLVVAVLGFTNDTYAEEAAWDIENTLDISECRQGDTVTMSINLKGSGISSPQEIHSMKGTLEYDSSLFTVEEADILPAEGEKVQSCSFDQSSGTFDIRYSSDITVQDGGRMLQIRLHTAADASTGKTTLCVTQMKWESPAAGRDRTPHTGAHHNCRSRSTVCGRGCKPGRKSKPDRCKAGYAALQRCKNAEQPAEKECGCEWRRKSKSDRRKTDYEIL